MKNIISFLIGFLLILSGFSMQVKGQEKIISGMITTFDSIAVIRASVKVKGTKQTVFSDSLGHYSISCKAGDKLLVFADGFNRYSIKIGEKTRYVLVNLQLKPGPENVEYAIGYGHVKEKDRLSAISSLKNGTVDFSQYRDIPDLIKGRFPGVSVKNGEIVIRGTKSINSSNAALIVIDGIVLDYDYLLLIPPSNVASIDVLKDAASSIYGSRGANGVVIIQTKK